MVRKTTIVEEWKFVIQHLVGVQCVMMGGILLMAKSPAVSWASLKRVPYGQMLTMAKVVDPYCWMMFPVLATNPTFGTAPTLDGINITVAIMKMLVLNVIDFGYSGLN